MNGIHFKEISGINFSTDEIRAADLSNLLCKIVSFLQNLSPYEKLEQFDDWWEHDGLNFHKRTIAFQTLLDIVVTPKNIFEEMPEDFNVFVGIFSHNKLWYLRFYLDCDENIENSNGRMDITLPEDLACLFETEIVDKTEIEFKSQDAQSYYNSILC